jgi:hypothetical protein
VMSGGTPLPLWGLWVGFGGHRAVDHRGEGVRIPKGMAPRMQLARECSPAEDGAWRNPRPRPQGWKFKVRLHATGDGRIVG